MKIITFNIWCANGDDESAVQKRSSVLSKVLRKYDADIFGFQEYTQVWDEELKNEFGAEYEILKQYRTNDEISEATPIFFKKDKFELINSGHFWFSDTPWVESECYCTWGCKRICQWVVLKEIMSGQTFLYINTHFGFGENEQIKSIELIRKTKELIGVDNCILTGDYNMSPGSVPYNKMIEYFTDFNKVTANYEGTTFYKFGEHKDVLHIDYCFYNGKNISPEKYTLIDDTVDGKYPSDHFGILFELNFN